jgi:hypothetical protein
VEVDPRVRSVVMRGLAVVPGARPDMKEIVLALEAAKSSLRGDVSTTAPGATTYAAGWGAGAAALLTVAGLWRTLRRRREESRPRRHDSSD